MALTFPSDVPKYSWSRIQEKIDSGTLSDKERIEAEKIVAAHKTERYLIPDDFLSNSDGRPNGLIVWRDQQNGTPELYTPYWNGYLHGKVTTCQSSLSWYGQSLIFNNYIWKRPSLAHVQIPEPLASITSVCSLGPLYVFMDKRCENEAEFIHLNRQEITKLVTKAIDSFCVPLCGLISNYVL